MRRQFTGGTVALLAGGMAVPMLLAEPPRKSAFDANRAKEYLKQVCDIGPRVSGSQEMKRQQKLIESHFTRLGAKIAWQRFTARQTSRPTPVEMANLIVSFHPERPRRVLFCTHYDTRPIADQEPDRRDWARPFVSANDGASGVAWLMEFAHHVKDVNTNVGVDFAFFDGEEYILDSRPGVDTYFFGSEHFATDYGRHPPKHRYIAGVLLDLFAGANAKFPFEQNSLFQAGAVAQEIWKVAKELNEPAFEHRIGPQLLDDHLALNRAGIPTVDIIDFDYPHWHRLTDTPDKVSGETMAKVARVLSTWLSRVK